MMSFKAMAFATEQQITQTSPQSHLLLILASYANDQNECYPSVSTMMKKTRLSEKTVRKCLKELIELELILDTQKLSAFQSKIYRINTDLLEQNADDTPSKNTGGENLQGVVNLPPNTLQNYQTPPSKSTPTPPSRFTTQSISNNHKDNHKNINTRVANQKNSVTDLVALGVDEQVAKDYLVIRKNPLTQTALNGITSQSKKAGISLGEAVQFAVESNWQSFRADWYFQRIGQPKQVSRTEELAAMANNFGENFYSRNSPSRTTEPVFEPLGVEYYE